MSKRPIAAMDLGSDVIPGTPPTDRPELTWIDPAELVIDDAYQRGLSDRSVKQIRRIVAEFDWRRLKPPIVTWTDDGLEVIDGQHTAIAAVCHPGVDAIPVVVVAAAEQQDRAAAFIGHNRDRIAVSALQLQAAAVVAGDKDAVAVDAVCRQAGINLLRNPPSAAKYQPRDTVAAEAINHLVRRRGRADSVIVLTVLALAEFAPITASHIKAVDAILHDEAVKVEPEMLTRVVMAMGAGPAEREAKTFAATHKVPLWKGLVAVWLQAARKRGGNHRKITGSSAGATYAENARVQPPVDLASQNVDKVAVEAEAGPLKPDARPGRHGYQPGPLIRRCASCGAKYIGGVRATTCADCAYRGAV